MLAVAGCQSGDGGGGFLGMGGGSKADPKVEEGKILASELLAYCPQVTLREGTAFFDSYAKGGEGDKTKIVYQTSIADVTRSCTRADGMLTMNVAVAGRVVPGPLGKAGTVTMPIRVAVMRGSEVLYSKLHQYQVTIGSTSAATQFVFNDANVTVPNPVEKDLRVFAGFDEGPVKKKPAEDAF
jgi:hypothetical protein